jgi:TonB family protein
MRRTALVLSFTIICAIFAAGQAKPDRLNVSPEIMEKRLVKRVPPKFPLGVRPNGSVRLKVVVDTSGHPASIEQTSGDSVLGAAMVDAVKQYEYQPYLVDGKPVEVETTVNVTFKTTVSSALVDNPPPQGVVGDNPGGIPAGQSGGLATEGTKRGVTVPLRVRISSGVASGLIVKKVAPLYPEEAREEHVEGYRAVACHDRQRRKCGTRRSDQRTSAARTRRHRSRSSVEVQTVSAEQPTGGGRHAGAG